jgi:nucleotide-binding universal stress UspA family protein
VNRKRMPTILSPTRGGESSILNQDRAIALAKERNAELIFLYVSDVQFENELPQETLANVAAELEDLGQFILTMAKERAAQEELKAETLVLSGNFRQVLDKVIKENNVDTLILGSPVEEGSVTTPAFLLQLSKELVKEYSLDVILLRAGEILETISPE